MESIPELVTTLEDLLVREFRACQAIHTLTQDERLALSRYNVPALSTFIEEKEALLDELGQVEEQRRVVVQDLAQRLGLRPASPSIAEIAAALQPQEGRRINRLREGIVALSGDIRELTSGNRALAISALERVDAVQTFILELYKPTINYQAPGTPARVDSDLAMGVDQRM